MNEKKIKLNISGMSCVNCAKNINTTLNKKDGVISSQVNFSTSNANITYNEDETDSLEIIQNIKALGYKASLDLDSLENEKRLSRKKLQKDFFIALISTISIFVLGFLSFRYDTYLIFIFAIIVQFISGRRFYKASFKALQNKTTDMNVLVALGTSAAFFYSTFVLFFPNTLPEDLRFVYFDGSAVIITFVLLGRYLEDRSKAKATAYLNDFIKIAPTLALRENSEGIEEQVNVENLNIGDIVIVKAGEKISADGVVIDGSADIDSSFITGESMLQSKQSGNEVVAGTINKSGYLKIKVEKTANEFLVSQISELLNESANKELPIARLADKISAIFVPSVISISIITFIIWAFIFDNLMFAIITSISVLIISCPCALGLATPITIVNAVGKGAKEGILFKNPAILEIINDIKYAVFDKTGTLTKAQIKVDKYLVKDEKYLSLIGAAEQKSEHPISYAITTFVKEKGIDIDKVLISKLDVLSGYGIKASINDLFSVDELYIGTKRLMDMKNITLDKEYLDFFNKHLDKGKNIIFASLNKECIGVFSLSDIIKEEAYEVIKTLKNENITPVLLTGDNEKVADEVAFELNIEKVYANVLPNEKYDVIKKLQENDTKVMFVGDGINDSLALKQANVGIALNSGSQIAKDAGDILLTTSNLENILNSINLSKYSLSIIKQNLFWAFIYNAIGIPLAAGLLYPITGHLLTPAYAGIAMSLSSITVVLNSLRIMKYRLD